MTILDTKASNRPIDVRSDRTIQEVLQRVLLKKGSVSALPFGLLQLTNHLQVDNLSRLFQHLKPAATLSYPFGFSTDCFNTLTVPKCVCIIRNVVASITKRTPFVVTKHAFYNEKTLCYIKRLNVFCVWNVCRVVGFLFEFELQIFGSDYQITFREYTER